MTNAHCITQFLAEATLGPLGLGMTGDQVIAAIGQPNDIGCQEIRNGLESSIWLYGTADKANLQLRLDRGTLEGIWLYFRGADDLSALPRWMDAESSPIRQTTRVQSFVSWAETLGLAWKTHRSLTFDNQSAIILSPSQVVLIWSKTPELLDAAMLTARTRA